MFSTTSENYWMFMNIVQQYKLKNINQPCLLQGLCQPILWQQGRGCAQGHLQTDSNRRASDVPPCWPLPAAPGTGDGWKDPLHLGHQVSTYYFVWSLIYYILQYIILEGGSENVVALTLWCVSLYIFTIYNPCIWTVMCRHPASGYVQGINDLVTPFLMVFLQVIAIFTYLLNIEKYSSMHLSLWRTLWRWM